MALCQSDEGDFFFTHYSPSIKLLQCHRHCAVNVIYRMIINKMPNVMLCEECCLLAVEMGMEKVTWFILSRGQTDPTTFNLTEVDVQPT